MSSKALHVAKLSPLLNSVFSTLEFFEKPFAAGNVYAGVYSELKVGLAMVVSPLVDGNTCNISEVSMFSWGKLSISSAFSCK